MTTDFHRQSFVHTISFIATVLVLGQVTFGQTFQRLDNETAEQFATRFKPDSFRIEHKIIETSQWDTTRKIIITFYSKAIRHVYLGDTGLGQQRIIGCLYAETERRFYQRIIIDTLDNDYYNKIESVFFANADTDKDKELCVILSWKPEEYYCKCDGTVYETRIYDNPNLKSINRLKYLREKSDRFSCFDGVGAHSYVEEGKYKTADDIKKELKRLGYN